MPTPTRGVHAALGGVPVEAGARVVTAYVVRLADEGTHGGEVGQVGAEGARLDEHVAERGRLDRAGQHRHAEGVRGQLAEQVVVGAAADDVHDLEVAAGQRGRRCGGGAGRRAARLSRMQRVISPAGLRERLAGLRAPARTTRSGIGSVALPGPSSGGSLMSTTVRSGAAVLASASERGEVGGGGAAVAPRPQRTPRAPRGPSRS